MLYRIKRKSDGLYSTGGGYPNWTSIGKSWTSLGRLKAHFSAFNGFRHKGSAPYMPLEDYEIEVNAVTVHGYLRMEEVFSG